MYAIESDNGRGKGYPGQPHQVSTSSPQRGAFGALLQQQRLAAGLSQEELAERAGVSRRGIADLERGARRAPHPATMRRLAKGLGLNPAGRAALFASAQADIRANGETALPRVPLPIPPTSFIGRTRELAEVRQLLRCTRLLTLTGAGGSGKTRLAIEAASRSSARYRDGTALILLAPIADPGLLTPAIAQGIGVREVAGVPLRETLLAYLRPRNLLLVVDNFEHLLAGAPLIGDLLGSCPDLAVLVTSREALHLQGEREYSVPPLELPAPGRETPPAALLSCASVELFRDRCAQISPDFRLGPETARIAADICLRLDGLPLAIELAAARVKVLSPAALLERLERRLPLLIGGARDLPARQRTLRDTIGWSHDLLSDGERRLFRRLAVFAGGCTLAAAEALCAEDADPGQPVLDGLASLVDKHLIQRLDGPGGEPRFVMLETIREFALEQLEASGEAPRTRERHADLFGRLADELEPKWCQSRREVWLARVEPDRDNLRAALRWSLEQSRPEPGLRVLGGLWAWWYLVAIREGLDWATAILDLPDANAPSFARSRALFTAALLAWGAGDLSREARLLDEGVAVARALGSQERLGWAMVLFPLDRPDSRARLHAHYAEGIAAAEASGNAWLVADAHLCYAASAAQLGDPVTACREGLKAAEQFRALGDDWFEGLGEEQVGLGLLQLGKTEQAAVHLRAALRLVQDAKWRAVSQIGLGFIARQQRDTAAMGGAYADALACCRDAGDIGNAALALEGLAAFAMARGDVPESVRLLGAAEAARRSGAQPTLPGMYERLYPETEAAARQMLGDDSFATVWRNGHRLTLDQVVTTSQALLG